MTRILLALVIACAACGGSREPVDDHDHDAGAETGDAHTAAAVDADVVRIDPEMMRDLRITTGVVESRPSGDGVTALGEIGVNEEAYAEVGTTVAARVTEVRVDVGQAVSVGQALATLESVELGKAGSDLMAAKAHAALARRTLERKRQLAAERIVPRREVEEAEAAASAADAELRAAESGARAVGVTPTETGAGVVELRSPIAGTVIDRGVVRGQMIEPTPPAFRIADLSHLWLTVHAFERDAVRVATGARARVTLAATPGQSFTGTVTLVGQRVDPGSRTIPIRIEVPNAGGLLRPGMSASAWVPLGDGGAAVVAVPAASLQRVRDGWTVFLPRREGVFEVRGVGRGRDLGGEVEIVHGLAPGETVVVEGAFLLKTETEKSSGEGEHHDH